MRPEVYSQLQKHFEKMEKWKSLDNAYVNFTHFTPIMEKSDGFAFTKDGFFGGWQRHVAYILEKKFPACDIAIPMAFRFSDNITPDCISYIMISLKNRGGNDMIGEDYLPKKCVEGVYSSGESGENKIVKSGKADLLALTLHSLKFINPKHIPSSRDIPDDAWIQTTKDKPFIAFAMSMGSTEREEDLFYWGKGGNPLYIYHITYSLITILIALLLA